MAKNKATKATATVTRPVYTFVRSATKAEKDSGIKQVVIGQYAPAATLMAMPKRLGESSSDYTARVDSYKARLSADLQNDSALLAALLANRPGESVSRITPSTALLQGDSAGTIWVSYTKPVDSAARDTKAAERREKDMAARRTFAALILSQHARLLAGSPKDVPKDYADFFTAESYVARLTATLESTIADLQSQYRKAADSHDSLMESFMAAPAAMQGPIVEKARKAALLMESLAARLLALGVNESE